MKREKKNAHCVVITINKKITKTPKGGRLDLNINDASHILVFGFLMQIIMHKKDGTQIKMQGWYANEDTKIMI